MEPVVDQRVYSRRYQVTHLIARGGTATVYRAQDLMLNRPVALKVLYPELSVDQNFVERFRREAQAAANLSHPNIVPVFDWGEDNGAYFIVMELIEGSSLAGILAAGRRPTPQRAATLVAQVASALAYAHRAGVVHRDIKPGNILLTTDGQIKVTDFGIAQAISTQDNLTASGSVMGTATYFSPEQAEGAMVDGRSDVYSLGVVLYELLAGRPPFTADTPVAVATMHVRDAVPALRAVNAAVPADLEAVTMYALGKRPASRYQTADDLRADLLRFAEGQPVLAGRGGMFAGDATQAVSAVSGERTQAVPVLSGPRTDVRRRRNRTPLYASLATLVLVIVAAVGYVTLQKGATTTMPNVVGQSISSATGTLRADGLQIQGTNLVQSSEPTGTVVSTRPRAGAKVTSGQGVTLNISLGQSSTPVTIPDTTGMSLANAESTLSSAGLSYVVAFTSTVPASGGSPNVVLSQSPTGGTQGHTGDKVTIQVLASGSNYPVPDVVGQSPLEAATTLGQASLTVGATQGSQCSNTQPVGVVVATLPAVGQPVTSGTSIQLILSTGFCSVVVPTVSAWQSNPQTKDQATAAMQAQGLQVTFVNGTGATCPVAASGYVVAQSVPGGEAAQYDDTITLTYCP
jgi:eukaryotic-like serine/threonine-protein kinase